MHWEKTIHIRITLRRIVGTILATSTVANLIIAGAAYGAASDPPALTQTLAQATSSLTSTVTVSTSASAASEPSAVTHIPGVTLTETSGLTPTEIITATNTLTATSTNTPPSPTAPLNSPPVAVILYPGGQARLPYNNFDQDLNLWYTEVVLEGSAADKEDDVLSESSLVWSTNFRNAKVSRVLGTGNIVNATLYSDTCSGISHRITLTATDSQGDKSTVVINVFIGEGAQC